MRMSVLRYTCKDTHTHTYTHAEKRNTPFRLRLKCIFCQQDSIQTHICREKNTLFQLKFIFFQRDPEHQQLHKAGSEEIILLKICCKICKVVWCFFNINPKQRSVYITLQITQQAIFIHTAIMFFSFLLSDYIRKNKQPFRKKKLYIEVVCAHFVQHHFPPIEFLRQA